MTRDDWDDYDRNCLIQDCREEETKKPSHRCVCGPDLPGTCPGPMNCPYSGDDDGDEDEA